MAAAPVAARVPHIGVGFQKMGGKQCRSVCSVAGLAIPARAPALGGGDGAAELPRRDRIGLRLAGEKPAPRPRLAPVIAQEFQQRALSPNPRMRMSSINRSRSGVVLSSVMATSCLKTENTQSSIGSKIFVADLLGLEKFPPLVSLGVTLTIIVAGILWSLYRTRATVTATDLR